jgi:hypothetical protein
MVELLTGGIATASLLAGLFFLRYWRSTRDPFFLLFAIAFWIEGAHRFILNHYIGPNEDSPLYYLVRIVAYGLIIAAIVMKNRRSS